MKYLKNYKAVKNFIPAIIVLILVVVSLESYNPKTFATKVKEESYTSKASETSGNSKESSQATTETKANFNTPLSNNLNKLGNAPKKISKVVEKKDATYKDGDFYGEAQGFRGNVQVCVTIKNNKITAIKVVKSQDDQAYFSKATTLLSKIVKGQTTNVDTVSGATYSSNGLIGAVRNALEKALVQKTKKKSNKATTTNKNNNKKSEKKNTTKGKIPYKDGVYYGTGEGYKGDVKVAVVIENQKIQYILIMENEDDQAYFSKAKGVLKNVLKYQKTDVDTVSGATYSSKGILEAIDDALNNAKKATEGNKNNQDTNTDDNKKNDVEETTTIKIPETGNNVYKDGTYTVTGICSPDDGEDFEAYTLSATVTIKNDVVTNVTDIKGIGSTYIKANDWYLKRAINGTTKEDGIVKQILAKGNANGIDSVSRATCSSNAIVEVVKKALEGAKN